MSDHLFTTFSTWRARSVVWETGKCPLLPGGLGQLFCQALELSATKPYLLLWATLCQRSGATNVATLSLLKVLGFVPSFRWVKPGVGCVVTSPVSKNDSQYLSLTQLIFSRLRLPWR